MSSGRPVQILTLRPGTWSEEFSAFFSDPLQADADLASQITSQPRHYTSFVIRQTFRHSTVFRPAD